MDPFWADDDGKLILAQTRGLWRELHGRRFLITGGTGFFGSWLLSSLAHVNAALNLKLAITVVARNPEALQKRAPHVFAHPAITYLRGDVRTFEYPAEPFDYVVHAASPVDPKAVQADRLQSADIIVNGTLHVLQGLIQRPPRRVLYISSGAVYGPQPPDLRRMTEDFFGGPDITQGAAAYGEAKRYAELLCTLYGAAHHLPISIVRPFTFVGPMQDLRGSYAVMQFMAAVLAGDPIRIEGDGTALRSYCYAADLTVALWKVLFQGQAGRAYNIGAEEEISILDLARRVVDMTGRTITIEVLGAPVPGRAPSRYIPDTSRIKTELGYQPHTDLDTALKKTMMWMRAQYGK